MSETVIKVESLSKKYRIGAREGYKTFRETLVDAAKSPFQRIAGLNPKSQIRNLQSETIWALKDVSFEVKQGEVIGIIGRNGAGKTTLLKILSKITEPTEGRVELRGRVGSLLEVGTGFHPELTGHENIYLYGAILGMNRWEVTRKFDEIVAFAEIEKFIDTPVKRYSSGMYMRLAFAVAAHMETEILLVDEVLAVGDSAFQKKCLGKMGNMVGEGRTVLLVSHNMGAILQLCEKAILLENGYLHTFADAHQTTRQYLQMNQIAAKLDKRSFKGTVADLIQFDTIMINDIRQTDKLVISPSSNIRIKVTGRCREELPGFRVTFSIFKDGVRLLSLHDVAEPQPLLKGSFESGVEIPAFFLRPGEYSVAIGGHGERFREWVWGTDLIIFFIPEEWGPNNDPANIGLVNLPQRGYRNQDDMGRS